MQKAVNLTTMNNSSMTYQPLIASPLGFSSLTTTTTTTFSAATTP
jgi:hypothetical protein